MACVGALRTFGAPVPLTLVVNWKVSMPNVLSHVLFSFLLLSISTMSFSATSDCREPHDFIDRAMCQDGDIGKLSSILLENLDYLLEKLPEAERQNLKAEQEAWLLELEPMCSSDLQDCFRAYAERIVDIKRRESSYRLQESIATYSSMNQLIWDGRFRIFLKDFFASHESHMLSYETFKTWIEVSNVLGGPPNDLVKQGSLVVGVACRPHSCPEKGIVIYDTETADAIFGVIHFIDEDNSMRDEAILSVFYKNLAFMDENENLLKEWISKEASFSTYRRVEIK